MPDDINQACVDLVAWRFTERSRIQQVSKNLGGEVVTYSTEACPKSVKVVLQNWRKVVGR
jgi:hypothetical protein